jgi:hypothetical protein
VDEPTGHTIDGTPWEEPRGPHLPDRLTAIPLLCWPFIALAIVQLAVGVSDIRSLGELDLSFALSWVADGRLGDGPLRGRWGPGSVQQPAVADAQ